MKIHIENFVYHFVSQAEKWGVISTPDLQLLHLTQISKIGLPLAAVNMLENVLN